MQGAEKEQCGENGQSETITPPAGATKLEEEFSPPGEDCRGVESCPRDSDTKQNSSEPPETSSLRVGELDAFLSRILNELRWNKQPMVWVSIVALVIGSLVSILAAYLAFHIGAIDLQFQQGSRLTTLIQQLSETRGRIAELSLEHGDKAPIPSVDLRQPLIEEALGYRESANSFQMMVIAQSLNETNQPDRAEPIAAEAEEKAKTPLEKVLAAQVHAVAYFNQGDIEKGREAYLRALRAVDPMNIKADLLTRTLYQLETEQFWISSELRIGNCPGAKERLRNLEMHRENFPKMLVGESERRVKPTRDLVLQICP